MQGIIRRHTQRLCRPPAHFRSTATSSFKSNIAWPPFDTLEIEASGRTYELTYRQPIVQTPRRQIAIGIGAGSREKR
ncbi:hypothetical protein [Microcoleus sp. Pol11C3]|uniref:hypothetical protein n=1 Tax=Microcoleus sp. Pol11C3 TaxID=3055390 RepID=UPI002FD3DB3E